MTVVVCPAKMIARAVLTLLLFLLLGDPAAAEVRLFKLQHRSSGELAEIVRSVVSDEARVAAHNNTLVVNAGADELAAVAALVADYDQPLRMLRVSVEQGRHTDGRKREVGASGHVQNGSGLIAVDGTGGDRQGHIFISSGGSRISVSGQDSSNRVTRQASQFMVVLEGSPARVSVGRSVPFTSSLRSYWRKHPRFIETVEYHQVDTGFEVLPAVHGDMVELEIRPFMSFLDPYNPQQILFSELATRVRFPLGAWYDLGGHLIGLDGLNREILMSGASSGVTTGNIRVRVDPEG